MPGHQWVFGTIGKNFRGCKPTLIIRPCTKGWTIVSVSRDMLMYILIEVVWLSSRRNSPATRMLLFSNTSSGPQFMEATHAIILVLTRTHDPVVQIARTYQWINQNNTCRRDGANSVVGFYTAWASVSPTIAKWITLQLFSLVGSTWNDLDVIYLLANGNLVVCCVSAVKCLCILVTILVHKDATISTIGDAVASFLEFPDETSAHMGLVSKSTLKSAKSWNAVRTSVWEPKRKFRISVPSWKRWTVSVTL